MIETNKVVLKSLTGVFAGNKVDHRISVRRSLSEKNHTSASSSDHHHHHHRRNSPSYRKHSPVHHRHHHHSSRSDLHSEKLHHHGLLSSSSPLLSDHHHNDDEEVYRVSQVGRQKDFVHFESVDGGKVKNVLQGLELHTQVFNEEEQKRIVDFVYHIQTLGRARKLRERTYSEPRKWKRGKGRVTMQFGCCYNYAVDKRGNKPGIVRDEEVDPIPPLFRSMIQRMVKWSVLPPTCVPDSCIVNIYEEGDCIPPHIDHHDFLRPFCTVSFLAECNILFGSNLDIVGDGEFSGPVSIPLPIGSVLVLKGNGADVAKHCVPGVPAKRISITFRKMDESKLPFKFRPDPELQGIHPLVDVSSPSSSKNTHRRKNRSEDDSGNSSSFEDHGKDDDFLRPNKVARRLKSIIVADDLDT
ncbi:Oxoglutarate/iron-dependent dioxygenase [Macleaya cordata]|uniref:Oxoglutarate/iron-dependent dioxygenase n=1 Tax=Macleaya cordata TaxID=56857 RepID=A0A200PQZ7_MACCD|nr:Oxoglutarate/iron-dependent dioxygenase [Macleaya cordata]